MKAMNILIRRRGYLAILPIVAASLLVGCTKSSDGTASPTMSSTTVATNTPKVNPFADTKACTVLDNALTGQGFPQSDNDIAGGDNSCKSDKPLYGGLTLALQSELGIDDLNADKSKQHVGEVNGRESIQVREGIGSKGDCAIAIKVAQKSRALLSASLSSGTTDEACNFAYDVAKKVEPQLPKGN